MKVDYKAMLKNGEHMLEVASIKSDIDSASDWEEVYWIGRFLFDNNSGVADKLIMDAYEKAFSLGLNIRVNKDFFLEATQQIAKIYFQFRMYDEAINKLMVLDSNMEQLPDWVNLYYASAQIHTDNVLYWAEVPALLFNRIDGINEKDSESVRRRKYLFLEFLNRLCVILEGKSVNEIATEAILSKAVELGLDDAKECMQFKTVVGVLNNVPGTGDSNNYVSKSEADAIAYESIIEKLKTKILELQKLVDEGILNNTRQSDLCAEQEKHIKQLQKELDNQRERNAVQGEELKAAKEREYIAQNKCSVLAAKISEDTDAQRQIEQDSYIIGALRTDIDDLKSAVTISKRNNDILKIENVEKSETIERLRKQILQDQKDACQMQAIIESQNIQIELLQTSLKNDRFETKYTAKQLLPEEESVHSTLIDILKVDNFLPRKQKILIIGGTETKEAHLRGKLKNMGFDFAKDQLEFELDYDDVKAYAGRIKPWSGKYAGIIVGPCPHKAKDIDGYSSFIEQIKTEEGYPHIEEARDKSGVLKISNSSLGEAMMKMAIYLQSIT